MCNYVKRFIYHLLLLLSYTKWLKIYFVTGVLVQITKNIVVPDINIIMSGTCFKG